MIHGRAGRLVLVALLTALSVSSPSAAQVPGHAGRGDDDPREKERNALYDEGLAFARAGRWTDAAERFGRVIAIRSSPKALLALATAQAQAGRLTLASRTFRKALADARAAGLEDDATVARQGLGALTPRVPRITIGSADAVPSDAQARVDGSVVPIGQTVEVDPGAHTIVVSAEGFSRFSTTVTVSEGDKRDVRVDLVREQGAPPAAVSSISSPSDVQTRTPWGLVALGAAGVGVASMGAFLDLHGLSEHNALATCVGCTQDAVSRAQRDMWIGTGLFWAGIAAVATAGVLYVFKVRAPSHGAAYFAPAPGGAAGVVGSRF